MVIAESMTKTDRLAQLKNLMESYDIRFTDDLDACVRAYDEPNAVLRVYVENKWETERKGRTADSLRANARARPSGLIDVIVDNVRVRNENNKHWVIINAPLDTELVQKLMAADMNPIQFVFFHDADPSHEVLLRGEMSAGEWWHMVRKDSDDFPGENVHGTRTGYAEFARNAVAEPAAVDDEWAGETDDFGEETGGTSVERGHDADADAFTHDRLMAFIAPEIARRLDEYADDLLTRWQNLMSQMPPNEKGLYMDFSVIECKADFETNPIEIIIRDTLYHIKK